MRARLCLLLAATMLVAACGSEQTSSEGGPPGASRADAGGPFPVTVEAANGKLVVEERPARIVSLSPTATEILFAIDAGGQVVAVDDNSDFPPRAPTTGLSGFQPNVEAIASYDPDLVVVSTDPGGLERSLEKLEIPVLLQPAARRLSDTYAQIRELGTVTGNSAEATGLVGSMRTDVKRIAGSVPTFDGAPTYYHELDDTYFTATSHTFIGHIYALLGLENIADAAPKARAGYVQLSGEFIIEADPDLIFLADTECCDQSEATVAKRPGWDRMAAVERDKVVELDDDVASRWGPRVVDFLEVVARAVSRHGARAGAGG